MTPKRAGRRFGIVLLVTAALAVTGVGVFLLLLSGWTRTRSMSARGAEEAFTLAVSGPASGPAYTEITPEGLLKVHRELEATDPVPLRALHVMAWDPAAGRLVTVEFPYWFVRLKFTDTINLGTLLAAATGDWERIDLRITEEDLQRRGPGLVLDHELKDGGRILLWTQ